MTLDYNVAYFLLGTPIDQGFPYITVDRSSSPSPLPNNITIRLENGTVSKGEIMESGLVHHGYVIFPDEIRHNFW